MSGLCFSALKGCAEVLEGPREWSRLATSSFYIANHESNSYPLCTAAAITRWPHWMPPKFPIAGKLVVLHLKDSMPYLVHTGQFW